VRHRLAYHHDHVRKTAVGKFAEEGGPGSHPWFMERAVMVETVLGSEMEAARIIELTLHRFNQVKQ